MDLSSGHSIQVIANDKTAPSQRVRFTRKSGATVGQKGGGFRVPNGPNFFCDGLQMIADHSGPYCRISSGFEPCFALWIVGADYCQTKQQLQIVVMTQWISFRQECRSPANVLLNSSARCTYKQFVWAGVHIQTFDCTYKQFVFAVFQGFAHTNQFVCAFQFVWSLYGHHRLHTNPETTYKLHTNFEY